LIARDSIGQKPRNKALQAAGTCTKTRKVSAAGFFGCDSVGIGVSVLQDMELLGQQRPWMTTDGCIRLPLSRAIRS